MAKVLKEFAFQRPGVSLYPWHDWFDGQIWELTHGKDFNCVVVNFRSAVYVEAKRRGKKVRISLRENSVVIQAWSAE